MIKHISAGTLAVQDMVRSVEFYEKPARWSAAAFLEIEKSFRKIMGYRDLWALKAILDGSQPATRQVVVA